MTHSDTLGPGDVQWMTAGRGLQHEELHSDRIKREGGTLEMVQLWVNLPQEQRNVAPRYQHIRDGDIPVVTLPGGGRLRVIAGSYGEVTGPAKTDSPLALWDGYLPAERRHAMDLPAGWTVSVQLLSGRLRVNGDRAIEAPETVSFATEPGTVDGTDAELKQAYADFRRGVF